MIEQRARAQGVAPPVSREPAQGPGRGQGPGPSQGPGPGAGPGRGAGQGSAVGPAPGRGAGSGAGKMTPRPGGQNRQQGGRGN
jgi:hypothetical protein